MFCTQCGFQNADDSNFCKKCGLQISPIADGSSVRQVHLIPTVVVQNPPLQQLAQPKIIVHQKSSAGAVFLTLFLVGIVGFGAFAVYQREQQKKIFGFEINRDGISTSWNLPQVSSQSTPQRNIDIATTQPDYSDSSSYNNSSAGRCFLSNNGNNVNVRSGCSDDRDCTNDESSIYASLPDGTEINILSNQQSISSGMGYDWLPIDYEGYTMYIASSKVYCK